MKKFFLISIFATGLLFFSNPVFAYYVLPNPAEIDDTVNFYDFAECEGETPVMYFVFRPDGTACKAGGLPIDFSYGDDYPYRSIDILNYTYCVYEPYNPVGDWNLVEVVCAGWVYPACDTYSECIASTTVFVNDYTFTVNAPPLPPQPKYLSLSTASSSEMLGALGSLFSDLWPLIAIMAGIPLAFYVLTKVQKMTLVKEKAKKTGVK